MTNEITAGALAAVIITFLVTLGINVLPEDTHYCEDLALTMKCDRLSSTGSTCYPTTGTMTGKKYCGSGWLKILKENNDPKTIECYGWVVETSIDDGEKIQRISKGSVE